MESSPRRLVQESGLAPTAGTVEVEPRGLADAANLT
jgi:hypothetical protein